MMPTNGDRQAPRRSLPVVRDDLMRLAGAGASGLVRVRTERSACELAEEAYAAGRADALTPASVADWLSSWLPPEQAGAGDWGALRRVVALLRSRP